MFPFHLTAETTKRLAALSLFFIASLFMTTVGWSDSPQRALILDGQNNHGDWPKTTMMMKRYLEDHGGFEVDISRMKYVWKGEKWLDKYPLEDGQEYEAVKKARPDENYSPDFKKYDVVISNLGYGAAAWPEKTQYEFQKYIRDGGGLVIIHAANNSFGQWREFNEMIGIGGWGGRDEKSGPYVYYNDDGKEIRDQEPGKGGGHGPQHKFQVVTREPDHPIMAGLPKTWLHAKDELYHKLRGPAVNMKILATSFAAKNRKGSGRHEPMIMTVDFGKGRVFHTPMGHADYSLECVGFITLFVRGTQWAATGEVQFTEVPDDFPSSEKSSSRKFE